MTLCCWIRSISPSSRQVDELCWHITRTMRCLFREKKLLFFERRCSTDKNIPERTKFYCTTLVSLPNDSNYVNDLFFGLCVVTSTFLKPVQTVNLFFCSLLHIHKQLFTTVFVPQKVEESKDADTHWGELRKARSLSQPKRGSFRLFQIRKTVFGAAEK